MNSSSRQLKRHCSDCSVVWQCDPNLLKQRPFLPSRRQGQESINQTILRRCLHIFKDMTKICLHFLICKYLELLSNSILVNRQAHQLGVPWQPGGCGQAKQGNVIVPNCAIFKIIRVPHNSFNLNLEPKCNAKDNCARLPRSPAPIIEAYTFWVSPLHTLPSPLPLQSHWLLTVCSPAKTWVGGWRFVMQWAAVRTYLWAGIVFFYWDNHKTLNT